VTVKRKRVIDAAPAAVWDLVSDPHHLPRWWPQVQRVEEVTDDAWTKVLRSPKGKTVRADYTLVESDPGQSRVWRQEVDESPFEAILSESVTEISLAPEGDGATRVEMRVEQQLRGRYRYGGFLLKRATRRQLDEALDGIEEAVGR
jgi:uncharacterized protein YndB with AHSA1/START domain